MAGAVRDMAEAVLVEACRATVWTVSAFLLLSASMAFAWWTVVEAVSA